MPRRAQKYEAWRIYFNCKQDYPIIWCIDQGDILSQIRLRYVRLIGCDGNTATDLISPTATRKRRSPRRANEPHAWISVLATPVFDGGGVTFYG